MEGTRMLSTWMMCTNEQSACGSSTVCISGSLGHTPALAFLTLLLQRQQTLPDSAFVPSPGGPSKSQLNTNAGCPLCSELGVAGRNWDLSLGVPGCSLRWCGGKSRGCCGYPGSTTPHPTPRPSFSLWTTEKDGPVCFYCHLDTIWCHLERGSFSRRIASD